MVKFNNHLYPEIIVNSLENSNKLVAYGDEMPVTDYIVSVSAFVSVCFFLPAYMSISQVHLFVKYVYKDTRLHGQVILLHIVQSFVKKKVLR